MVYALVEGYLDGRLLKALFRQLHGDAVELMLRDAVGGANFWKVAERYNEAARHQTMIGLADLEQVPCPSKQLATLKGGVSAGFKLRLAVRMLESWVIADRSASPSLDRACLRWSAL